MKNIKLTAMFSLAALCASAQIQVEHLGVNNTLVRVNPEARWLMMPVQESNDDARINVLVDGRIDRTIFVRLAKSKVDYTVPLDLEKYRGHDVVLNVVTSQDRTSVREASNDACWANFSLTDTIDTVNREKYRPAFHHTPLYGWMNDPNGMFYKDGLWHLYYQWNPFGSKWQNMTWGHSTSEDLVNWNHYGPAIEPDGLGTIFSGSSAIDSLGTAGFGEGAVVSLYTSAAESQIQSMAHSNDGGFTFEKYPGNPVLTLDSEARDPNFFYDAAGGRWVLALAHALEHEMLFFTSPDLKEWTLQSTFGKGLGAQGGVWECPDLFELEVEDTGTKKWVLICNLNPGGPFGGSATQYFVGDFDGTTFTADTDAEGNVPTKWMDFGKDHYATVSFSDAPDNRRTVLGWMSNWQYAAEVPTTQFRSANTLPRDLSLFTGSDGTLYLTSAPSPEVDALRGTRFGGCGRKSLNASGRNFNLPADGLCEIVATLSAENGSKAILTLKNNEGENVVLTYDPAAATVEFDRRHAGISDFSQDFPAVTVAPVLTGADNVELRIFVDRSSIEVFIDGGKAVMTNLVFPTSPYTVLTASAQGNAELESLNIYNINH